MTTTERARCLALFALSGSFLLPTSTAAQVEPDLAPLLSAAEEDCAAERLDVCRARAELVLRHAPERSRVRVRARGLVAITEGASPALSEEEILEPLVIAAERAATARDHANLARHAATIRLLATEGSTALARLLAAEAAAAEPLGATSFPPARRETAPAPVVEPEEVPPTHEPNEPAGYHRRDDGELVDFYLMSAAAGAGFTVYLFAVNDWPREIAPADQGRVYAVAPVLGGALFLLLPFALDQIDQGMPAGAPGAIAMGLRFGMGIGGLALGMAQWATPFSTVSGEDAGHVLFGATLAGGLLFGSVAYLALPHPSQVQMIQNTGLWGGAVGGFVTLAVSGHVGRDRAPVSSGIALLGLGGGLITGSILSGLNLQLSSGRSWLGSLGMVSGAAGGMLLFLLIGGISGSFDSTIAGVSGVIGSTAGLTTALILTEGHHGEVEFPDGVTVGASVTPLDGGGVATVSGTF